MPKRLTYDEALREYERARQKHYRAANPSEAVSRRETTPAAMERRQERVRAAQSTMDFWSVRLHALRPTREEG